MVTKIAASTHLARAACRSTLRPIIPAAAQHLAHRINNTEGTRIRPIPIPRFNPSPNPLPITNKCISPQPPQTPLNRALQIMDQQRASLPRQEKPAGPESGPIAPPLPNPNTTTEEKQEESLPLSEDHAEDTGSFSLDSLKTPPESLAEEVLEESQNEVLEEPQNKEEPPPADPPAFAAAPPSQAPRVFVSDIVTIGKMKYKIETQLNAGTTNDQAALFIQTFRDEILKKIVADPNFHPNGAFIVSLTEEGFHVADTLKKEIIQTFDLSKENENTKQTIHQIRTALLDSSSSILIQKSRKGLNGSFKNPTPSSLPSSSAAKTHIPRGIPRLGNNCWINAALQLLLASQTFKEWIDSDEANNTSSLYRLRRFCKAYSHPELEKETDLDSQQIRQMIAEQHNDIAPNPIREEDPSTALSHILGFYPKAKKGDLQKSSTYECANMPSITKTTHETSNYLSVAIGNAASMQEMLNNYASEIPHEQYIREKNNEGIEIKYQATKTTTSFTRSPSTLFIQIKRFESRNSKGIKNQAPIDVQNIITYPLADGSLETYKLKGHINHEGNSVDSGHFKTYIYEGDRLYRCDDAHISTVPDAEIEDVKSQTYIALYERIDP